MNETIAHLMFSPENAELLYNNIRYILIRPETLVRFQKLVEESLGPMTSDLMFKAAYDIGASIGRGLMERANLSQQEMITLMLKSANELGWAKLYLKENENEQFASTVVLEAFNSAFASAYSQSNTPICHLLRGIFGGAFSQMIGPVIESEETECLAMGFPRCIFRFRIRRYIALHK